jgi:DNA-binding response OmpR family regulator
MSDIDGPDMAKWFYEELLSNKVIGADAVAYALDVVVGKLREKIPLVPKRWAPYIHMGA